VIRRARSLTELSRIHCADIVLPLAEEPGRELRSRCVVRPDAEQSILLQRLGLTLPTRLSPPPVVKMQWRLLPSAHPYPLILSILITFPPSDREILETIPPFGGGFLKTIPPCVT
jgi:hypothetical protein